MLKYKDVPYRRWGKDGKGLIPTKEGARVMKIALDAHQKGKAVTMVQSQPLTPELKKPGVQPFDALSADRNRGKTYDTISVTISD